MIYSYETTKEMDEALAYNAEKNGQTAAELFAAIVTADMGTLVRNTESVARDIVFAAYRKASVADKEKIDAIVAKAAIVAEG
jgi:hypothetical protein